MELAYDTDGRGAFIEAALDPVVRMLRHRLIHHCSGDQKRAAFLTLQMEHAMAAALQKQGMAPSGAHKLELPHKSLDARRQSPLLCIGLASGNPHYPPAVAKV